MCFMMKVFIPTLLSFVLFIIKLSQKWGSIKTGGKN